VSTAVANTVATATPPHLYLGDQRAASYIDRLLRGAKISELPVRFPRFELVINLKTAKAIGLTIPHNMLATADEVIQ
jgi:putative tryptophan/tyrosine transport system substrate-binding protein